jgi:membrane protease YdiL (CAAX protease family)
VDTAALLLLVVAYLGLASSRVVHALRRFGASGWRGGLLVALLLLPYVLATVPGAGREQGISWTGLMRMAAYLFLPGLVLVLRPRQNKPLDLLDLLAILLLWFPIEFGLLPEADASFVAGVTLPVPLLTAICLGLVLFRVIRPLRGIGYTFKLTLQDASYAFFALGAFALVGLPLGVSMGFIGPGPAPFDLGAWLLRLVAIYFLNALPEELLFRGIAQNLIEQRFGRPWRTLVVAAVIFGLCHMNNVTAHHGPPNWPYVAMATLAGLAYGWVWCKSGKITASAITHTLVNWMWALALQS